MKGKTETWEELKVALWYKFDEEIKGGNTGAWMQAFYKALDTYSAVLLASQKEAVYQQGRAETIEEVKKIIPKPFPYPEKSSMPAEWCSGYNSFRKVLVRRIKEIHQSTREK